MRTAKAFTHLIAYRPTQNIIRANNILPACAKEPVPNLNQYISVFKQDILMQHLKILAHSKPSNNINHTIQMIESHHNSNMVIGKHICYNLIHMHLQYDNKDIISLYSIYNNHKTRETYMFKQSIRSTPRACYWRLCN